METKMAVVETEVKNLGRRFGDFLDDVRALRGTWTGVTISIVTIIFAVLGFTMNGFNNVSDTQISLMKDQHEIKVGMKDINNQLVIMNASMEGIIKKHNEISK
jgi:hypothetical protein